MSLLKMKKLSFALLTLSAVVCNLSAQEIPGVRIPVAFYNVENLFDAQKGPNNDIDFTPEGANRWTPKKYHHKLRNLAQVIGEIAGDGPAIIGLSEVENRGVLEDLVKESALAHQNYQIIHYDSPDFRGIDCALLYNPAIFKPESSGVVRVDLGENAYPTRDILFATGTIDNEIFHFLVGHWPSRSGGEAASAPRRMIAAKTMRGVSDSLLSVYPGSKVMMMGDFNDDPISPSVAKGLEVKSTPENLGEKDYYTPMLRLYNRGLGTLAYRDAWNLFDMIVVNGSLLGEDLGSFKLLKDKKTGDYGFIFKKDYLLQQTGRYKGYPRRTIQSGRFEGGYSDHFPVYVYITKKVR